MVVNILVYVISFFTIIIFIQLFLIMLECLHEDF